MYLEESPYQRDQLINIDQLIGRALDHGVELGDDHHKTIENYVNSGLLPRLLNGQFPATALDRLAFIDSMLKKGKSIGEIKNILDEERKKFLKKPMDLSTLVSAYKGASKSLLMLGSVGFVIFLLTTGFVNLPDSTIKKSIGQPVGKVLAGFIKEAKPANSTSTDPLGLTNVSKVITINEKQEVIIQKTITADSSTTPAPINNSLINTNNLAVDSIDVKNILSKDITFPNLTGVGKSCVLTLDIAQVLSCSENLYWTAEAIKDIADTSVTAGLSGVNLTGTGINVARTGNTFALSLANEAISSINSVKNNGGDISLVAGAGVTITANDAANTITFNLAGSGVNADLFDSIDSTQFLRSDTSDNFTSGTLALDAGTTLNVLGTFTCTSCIGDGAIPDTITVANYLPLGGGTLTGGLTVSGVTGLVDTDIPNTITVSNYLPLAGGTMAGNIDFNNSFALNIGNAGTDFDATGGLTLAGGLTANGTSTFGSTSSIGLISAGGAAFATTVTQSTTKIADADVIFSFTSIAIGTDGLPVISYYDGTIFNLAVTKCGNSACTSGNTTTKISDANNVGIYSSIAIGTDGLPVISYQDVSATDLAVTKCGNAACTSGNTTTKITDANFVGGYTSIAIGTDGLPVISYLDVTAGDLAVTKCGNTACSSGNTTTKIADANSVGTYTSLAIGTDGLPVISYLDATTSKLAITKCGNAACTSGNTTTKIADTSAIGGYTSIAIGTDGLPVISYQDATATDLAITKCGNAACTSGNTTTKISDANDVGYWTSIAIGTDGLPVISYRDATVTDLAITKCANASCSSATGTAVTSGIDLGSPNLGFRNLYGLSASFGGSLYVGSNPVRTDNYLGGSTTPFSEGNLIVTGSISGYNGILSTIAPISSGTSNGFTVTPPANTLAGGTINGINIGSITTSGGTDTAITIGSGWDIPINMNVASAGPTCASLANGDFGFDSTNNRIFWKGTGGTCSYWNRTGTFDIAEHTPATESTEPGDILVIDTNSPTVAVKKSTSPYQQTVVGIESTDPTLVSNPDALGKANFVSKMALAGRVPTKVSTENGPIKAGDYLTSSSTAGVAMKATTTGSVVGKALEAYNGSAVGKILVFVNVSYYLNPNEFNSYTLKDETNLAVKLGVASKYLWKNSSGAVVASVSDLGEAIFSKVTTSIANVGKLVFGEIAVKKDSRSAGVGEISAGQVEVIIPSNKVRVDSLISLTANSEPDGVLYVKTKTEGESFVVGIKRFPGNTTNQKIEFNWLIVNQE